MLSVTYDYTDHESDAESTTGSQFRWLCAERGNTNGLLRQYLPKGSDLSVFTQKELDEIAWKLNTRPRKPLGFKCPAQLFTPDAFDFKQHHAALFTLRT